MIVLFDEVILLRASTLNFIQNETLELLGLDIDQILTYAVIQLFDPLQPTGLIESFLSSCFD